MWSCTYRRPSFPPLGAETHASASLPALDAAKTGAAPPPLSAVRLTGAAHATSARSAFPPLAAAEDPFDESRVQAAIKSTPARLVTVARRAAAESIPITCIGHLPVDVAW